MVTIREVAKAAGVSVATVSRALNGLSIVTPETRERIEKAALDLNYVPHSGARSLTRKTTDTIGVILPDLFGEFFSEIIRGIDMVVHGAGKHMLLGNMHGSTEETALAIRAMRGRVDGLLVMPPNSSAAFLDGPTLLNMPTILLNATSPNGTIPFVATDNYHGARLATEHLVERGAKKLMHITGPDGNMDASERKRGFCDVVRERLDDSDPVILPGNFLEDGGRNAARQVLAGEVTCDGVFAGNDMMGVDFLATMRDAGVAVGRDLLVAGFDDIPLARYVQPGLTTVHSDILRLGSAAAEMLLRALSGESEDVEPGMTIIPTLAVRGSTQGKA